MQKGCVRSKYWHSGGEKNLSRGERNTVWFLTDIENPELDTGGSIYQSKPYPPPAPTTPKFTPHARLLTLLFGPLKI
jgi:hypothetical protein